MRRVNSLGLAPCIVLSIIIHSLVIFVIYYKSNKKNLFVQVPFEVSFYSPVQVQSAQIIQQKEEIKPVEQVLPKEEKKVEKQVEKKKKITKDDILIKNKKTKKEEKKVSSKKEEPVEKKVKETVEEKPQVASEGVGSGEVVSSNKGIMLENKNFKYSYYTNAIVKKISKYWQWSSVTSSYRTIVYFKIARDGTAYDIKIKESSLDSDFDRNALRAVELSSPFGPLPSSYEEDYLGVYFEFKFH